MPQLILKDTHNHRPTHGNHRKEIQITDTNPTAKIQFEPRRDFQQYAILTSVDSDEPVQPHFKRRYSKCCSASSLTVIEYLSDLQRL